MTQAVSREYPHGLTESSSRKVVLTSLLNVKPTAQ